MIFNTANRFYFILYFVFHFKFVNIMNLKDQILDKYSESLFFTRKEIKYLDYITNDRVIVQFNVQKIEIKKKCWRSKIKI